LRALIELALNTTGISGSRPSTSKGRRPVRISAPRSTPPSDPGLGDKYRIPEKMGDNGESKMVSSYSVVVGLASGSWTSSVASGA